MSRVALFSVYLNQKLFSDISENANRLDSRVFCIPLASFNVFGLKSHSVCRL